MKNRRPRRPFVVAVLTLALPFALASCGGDTDEPAAATTSTAESGAPPAVSVSVREVEKQANARGEKPADELEVRSGDSVQVFVRVAKQEGPSGSVVLEIPRGKEKTLSIAAAGVSGEERGKRDIARLRADRRAVQLHNVRFVCRVDQETFCPAEETKRTTSAYELRFRADVAVPIVLVADLR